jgi:hypothetical protein
MIFDVCKMNGFRVSFSVKIFKLSVTTILSLFTELNSCSPGLSSFTDEL